jgi:endonuclease YncB( thermonuclease family)
MPRRRRYLTPRMSPFGRRVRYSARRAGVALLTLLVLAGIYAADRAGLFGSAAAVKPAGPDWPRYHDKTFRVADVVDGDTLDIDEPDRDRISTRIRLWGVDTPETKDPRKPVGYFGPQASAFTHRCCDGKSVRIELLPGKTRDRYDRLLAYVWLPDGTMLNRELVRQGFGYADPRFDHPYKSEFAALQAEARRARLGLWKAVHPAQLPYYMTDEKGKGRGK